MEAIGTRRVVKIGVTAVLYTLIAVIMSAFPYEDIRFRLSDMLLILCLFTKDAVPALTMGCFAANVFGPFTAIDVILGTSATFLVALLIYKMRARIGVITAGLIASGVYMAAVCAMMDLNNEGGDILKKAFIFALIEFLIVVIPGSVLKFHITRLKRLKNFLSDAEKEAPKD